MRAEADVDRGPSYRASAQRRDDDPAATTPPAPAAVPALWGADFQLQDPLVTDTRNLMYIFCKTSLSNTFWPGSSLVSINPAVPKSWEAELPPHADHITL